MQKIVLLIGKPCAGKSTWLSKFMEARSKDFVVLSVGKMLRLARSHGKLSENAILAMDSGKLLPDYVVINIILEAIRNTDKNVILDGFPRTKEQVEDILECGLTVDKAVHIYIDDEIALLRASGRLICEKCDKTYLPKNLAYIAPCQDVIPKTDGKCNYCNGILVRRSDDENARIRLATYEKETQPVLKRLKRCGVPVITLDAGKGFTYSEFEEAVLHNVTKR